MEYTVTLIRDSLQTPWGFRLQGGADLRSFLTVQRVLVGSPSDGELQKGDIILDIDGRDATQITHHDAENSIKSVGSELKIRIKRTGPNESLPHTSFQQSRGNMYRSPYDAYGSQFNSTGRPTPSSHDRTMLNLVQHHLDHPSHPNPSHGQNNWVPCQPAMPTADGLPLAKAYQPSYFNRPAPGAKPIKVSKNPYSNTANAAHLQYNSPLGLYSARNAQSALSTAIPGDSAAGQTIKGQINERRANNPDNTAAKVKPPRLTSHQGGEAKVDIVDSPTLRYVLREDQYKAETGHKPNVKFYKEKHEYGPGMGPLRIYREEVDQPVTTDF